MSTRIHVFAVAVETYQKTAITKVAHAENDAREFVKAWQTLGADPSDCVTLLSSHATKTAIESAFKKFLNGVAKGDTVVFFFAGHGIAFNDVSYVTTHDTQPGDIRPTSISLASILKQLRDSKSDRVLLFIDACESGLPISAGMRTITSGMTGEEMRQFCLDSEHHVAFAACKVDESSWSNPSLTHGIWSYAVIKALSGDAKDALDKGNLVTSDSLRDYLAEEVPRLLRITRTGNETQTPCCFGNATKQFIVADLADVLHQRLLAAGGPISIIKESMLIGEDRGDVDDLGAYQKPLYRLSKHSRWEQNFVENAGAPDVESLAKEIFERIKDSFGYKRKDVSYSNAGSTVSIKTPDFDVDVELSQDPEDAEKYVLKTQVSSFRRPDVIDDPDFIKIFTKYCDSVVIDLETRLDLAAKIDEIEAIEDLESGLDYDPDCTYFTLSLPQSGVTLHATADRMVFTLDGDGDLKLLIGNTFTAVAQLAGASITLGLPNSSPP